MVDSIIKLIIAEDHAVLRRTFRRLFERFPKEIVVIAEAVNGEDLIEKVNLNIPDVILTDIQMPVMNGIEATRIIKVKHPKINVIAISMVDDEEVVKDIIAVGAGGYLLKNADKDELVKAVKEVC